MLAAPSQAQQLGQQVPRERLGMGTMMRRELPWRGFALLTLLGLLWGCQANRNPQSKELAECLDDQSQFAAQVDGLESTLKTLAELEKERFIPPAKPTPIDPDLAERYTQEDRELDEQRYQQSLLAWEQLHTERYRLWLVDHTQRERALELQVERQAKALKQLNPEAVERTPTKPGSLRLNPEVVEKYSRCDPQAF